MDDHSEQRPETELYIWRLLRVAHRQTLREQAARCGLDEETLAAQVLEKESADLRLVKFVKDPPSPPKSDYAPRRRNSALNAGVHLGGHSGPIRKLSDKDMAMILQMKKNGEKTRAIASRFGICTQSVLRYIRRATAAAD